jgi:aspartyl/asparaginyl-tRNA synthetase
MVEQINLHNGQNVFTIYPALEQGKVRCVFPKELRRKAIEAVGNYVTVEGRLKYKKGNEQPYEIEVEDIEIYPPEEDLPKLSDLRGLAADAFGNKSSEEVVREIRDEWQ